MTFSHMAFKMVILFTIFYNCFSWCLFKTYFELSGSQINQVDWSPDGNFLVVASASKRVSVFSFLTSNVVWYETFSNVVNTAKFSKKGVWMAVGLEGDDTVHVYAVPGFTLNISARARHGNTEGVNQLDFNSDDSKMVTCGDDGYVNERNTNNLQSASMSFQQVLDSSFDAVSCKYSTLDRIGSSGTKGRVYYHNNGLGFQNGQDITYMKDIDFRPNNNRYIYGGCTCSTKVHEFDNVDDQIRDFIDTVNGKIWTVSHSLDQSYLAAGGQLGYFYIINTTDRTNRFFEAKFRNSTSDINSVRVSDDSNFVAVGRSDGIIDIYARVCKSSCPLGHYFKLNDCRLCSLDIIGCAVCKNSTICTSCLIPYFLNSSKKCQVCHSVLPGCQTCKSNSICLTCFSTHYLNGITCSICNNVTSNCQQCLNNSTCIKCSYSYYLTAAGACSLCKQSIQGCLHCEFEKNSSSSTFSQLHCTQCAQGYYASMTVCLPCHSSCLQCLNNGSCIACKQEYKLNGTFCISCSLDCQSCLENGTCLQCKPTTYLLSGNCLKCTAPCLTCHTTANTCLSCVVGYYITGTNVCTKCSAGCAFCNPFNGTCLSCPLGQYLSSANICSPCLNSTSHCSVCSSAGCLYCEQNYYLSGNLCFKLSSLTNCDIYRKNSSTLCDSCSLGYYLSSSGNCSKCQSNCFVCDNSTTCSQCAFGYFLNQTLKSCQSCLSPCITCNSSNSCLSCGEQSILSGTQCLKCWDLIPFCNSCINSTQCLTCFLGYKISSNNSCVPCTSPCSTCDSIGCLTCELGYFYQLGNCVSCPSNCASCSSLSVCVQCISGFVLNSSICISCDTLYPNCNLCSSSGCLKCQDYYFLNSTSFCLKCENTVSNCLQCEYGTCILCQVSYYLLNNGLSCQKCDSIIPNCQKCFTNSSCDQCRVGFYYQVVSKICQRCSQGCLSCSSQAICDICQTRFLKTSGNQCKTCSQQIFGCESCTILNNCTNCSLGFYLSSPTSCILCKTAIQGCISCISNTVCQSCDLGFYLNSTNKCQTCSTYGCSACFQANQSCISCLSGFYLKNNGICQLCSANHDNCKICNITSCLSCQTGNFLASGTCSPCLLYDADCLVCNQSNCLQCSSGKYLNSNKLCQQCQVTGCQICNPTGDSCIQCQNIYYKTGSICSLCSTMDEGCLSCQALNDCRVCKKGYQLEPNGKCKSCSIKFNGCQTCNNFKCLDCKTNYFYNISSAQGSCILCSNFLSGCSLCINQAQCLLCESGYYLSNFICKPCSQINQCYICQDGTKCLFCGSGYYLKNNQCHSCALAISGCLNCASEFICSSCSGNYQLFGGVCIEIKQSVSTKEYTGQEIRLISEYLNSTFLKHILHSPQWQFKKIEQEWEKVTKISLIKGTNTTVLTILNVSWNKNSLIFLTDNPYGQFKTQGAKGMPFFSQFTNRRLLTSLSEFNIQTSFYLAKQAISQLLPQLDTNGENLQLQYKLDNPQFYKSIISNQKYYYYIFGIGVTIILAFIYLVKICFVIPSTLDSGSIIPHILLMKLPAMVIYPTLGGYVSYCYGFTIIDFPWLNNFFSEVLSNTWDESPPSFKLFYSNLNISSTYLLGLIVFVCLYFPLYIFSLIKSREIGQNTINIINSETTVMQKRPKITNIQYFEKQRISVVRSFFYNWFIVGLTVSSVSSFIGMSLNPSSVISITGCFYLLGIIIYSVIVVDAVRSLAESIKKIRIIIKSTLMTLIYLSPVPLFTTVVVLDSFMMFFEYQQKRKSWVLPKGWLLNNILILVCYSSLIFLSNMLLGIIICSCCIVFVLGCDLYLQYCEYYETEKIAQIRNQKQFSENNLTIEEFMPSKKQQSLVLGQEGDSKRIKQKNLRIASSQNRLMKSQQIKSLK